MGPINHLQVGATHNSHVTAYWLRRLLYGWRSQLSTYSCYIYRKGGLIIIMVFFHTFDTSITGNLMGGNGGSARVSRSGGNLWKQNQFEHLAVGGCSFLGLMVCAHAVGGCSLVWTHGLCTCSGWLHFGLAHGRCTLQWGGCNIN